MKTERKKFLELLDRIKELNRNQLDSFDEEWEYQGKRKDQVEKAGEIVFWCFVWLAYALCLYGLYNFLLVVL